ncbi:MAG: hypothetical protein HPY71_12180 [Firmicutes bacterium]|nr:hypothetical protein [Bacillota bacterium]
MGHEECVNQINQTCRSDSGCEPDTGRPEPAGGAAYETVIHAIDPRAKLLCAAAFVILVVTMPPVAPWKFAFFLIPLGVASLSARIPPGRLLRRSLVVLPFAAMVACSTWLGALMHADPSFTPAGAGKAASLGKSLAASLAASLGNSGFKAWLSSLGVIILTSTTEFADLTKGMEHLRVPKVIAVTLLFLYRYMSVLGEEIRRMKLSYDMRASGMRFSHEVGVKTSWRTSCRLKTSRTGEATRAIKATRTTGAIGGGSLWRFKMTGYLIGSLFLRTWERAERISRAMNSRGFTGEMPGFKKFSMNAKDWLCLALFLILILAIRFMVVDVL